ncbi:MAG: UDP-N-acetylglucosamine 2-epimerase (hydrolyzing) [Magnetococcales bacterium]|nr:UDP-N-acetylglucosamine 2-epimerase (hydrolyzing) [Magnetococcales bacterium]
MKHVARKKGTRAICVVTGSRAEYGHLYWIMREIQEHPQLQLQVVATGMHLSPEFGMTVQQIETDGFGVDQRVEMLLSGDSGVAIAKSLGLGVIGFADALERLRPGLVLVLGDRFEALAAVMAAMPLRIPVAHVHGGEASEGVMDEAIRHALTKMAHLHFTAAPAYRQRVIQLGEDPGRVFVTGSPGLDHIARTPLLERDAWQQETGFVLGQTNILVTYHPVTLESGGPEKATAAILTALDAYPDARILFTRPNADTAGRIIQQMIDAWVVQQKQRAMVVTNLGTVRYLSALRHMDIMLGNSSSALIEAPCFKLPAINLGDRQRGRLKAISVIDCAEESRSIIRALEKGLDPQFRQGLHAMVPPYGQGDAARRIVEILAEFPLDDILKKQFHDFNLGDFN